jgi:hypothetical protein
MKQFSALLLLILVFSSCQPKERLQVAIDYIGQANVFMSETIGLDGLKHDVYKNYETVLALASPDQLHELISDDRAAVRIYGFQGMIESNHPETFTAFKNLVTDSTYLMTVRGDFMNAACINTLAANLLANDGLKREHYQFKGRERIVFDSLLLFSGYLPKIGSTLFHETVAPVDEHYETVRELAYGNHSKNARTGLANFKREADLDFLRSDFSINDESRYRSTMDIIARFPHPDFLPYLKETQLRLLNAKILNYNSIYLYLAILQYSPEDLKPFLEVVDGYQNEEKRQEHQRGAWAAAQLNSDPNKKQLVMAVPLEEEMTSTLAWLQGLAKYSHPD